MRPTSHIKRPSNRKKARAVKTLSAQAWAQVTVTIRQLATATA
ncbi:MAG: hypothetical protein SFW67_06965 [Myxococcaceae bacterium]|nr:hypothetical protein [Myxococcaceae bacterium]